MSSAKVEFYFSFRSPWSYLATPRMRALSDDYNVTVNLRVVDPIYIRYNDFFDKAHERWRPYFFVDLLRNIEFLGMNFGAPRPDPINTELPADSSDHLVLRLSPMGIAAQALGHGPEFAEQISHMVWDGTVDGWDEGEHIADAAGRAGLALKDIERWLSENDAADILATNNAALEEHHWGVPTMVFNGEPFFGQDKIDLLRWRLDQQGLRT